MAGRPRDQDVVALVGVLSAYAKRKVHPRMPLMTLLREAWSDQESPPPPRSNIYRYWGDRARHDGSTVVVTLFRAMLERRQELTDHLDKGSTMDEAFRRLEQEMAAIERPKAREKLEELDRLNADRPSPVMRERLAGLLAEALEMRAAGDGAATFLVDELIGRAEDAEMHESTLMREALLTLLRERQTAESPLEVSRAHQWAARPTGWMPALSSDDTRDGGVTDIAISLLKHHLTADTALDRALRATIDDLKSAGATVSEGKLYPHAALKLLRHGRVDDAIAALSRFDVGDVRDVDTLFALTAHVGRALYVHPELPQEPWCALRDALADDGEYGDGVVGALEVSWLKRLEDAPSEGVPHGLSRYWVEALVDQPSEAWSAIEAAEVVVHAWREAGHVDAAAEVARDVLNRCTDESCLSESESRTLATFRALASTAPAAAGPFDQAVDDLYLMLVDRKAPVRPRTRERLRRITELLATN